jgi:hypothetical protein
MATPTLSSLREKWIYSNWTKLNVFTHFWTPSDLNFSFDHPVKKQSRLVIWFSPTWTSGVFQGLCCLDDRNGNWDRMVLSAIGGTTTVPTLEYQSFFHTSLLGFILLNCNHVLGFTRQNQTNIPRLVVVRDFAEAFRSLFPRWIRDSPLRNPEQGRCRIASKRNWVILRKGYDSLWFWPPSAIHEELSLISLSLNDRCGITRRCSQWRRILSWNA